MGPVKSYTDARVGVAVCWFCILLAAETCRVTAASAVYAWTSAPDDHERAVRHDKTIAREGYGRSLDAGALRAFLVRAWRGSSSAGK